MGRPLLRIVLAGVLVVLPTACSLLVDTSGLAGPAEPSPGAAETSTEATTRDGADVLVPALDAADGAPPPCVDGANRFCDDFDHAGSKWEPYKNRGELSVDGNGLSLPNALRARIVAGANGGAASLGKDLPGNPASVRCELDVRLDAIPTTGETDILDLYAATPGGERHHFYFGSFDGAWSVGEFREAGDAGARIDRIKAIGMALPVNVWMHLVFDLTPAALTVTANGKATTLADLTVPVGAVSRRLNIGITFASPNVQSAVTTTDNVDCTLAP
jgi:hypothetical protein